MLVVDRHFNRLCIILAYYLVHDFMFLNGDFSRDFTVPEVVAIMILVYLIVCGFIL